jgi:hypothetical protein
MGTQSPDTQSKSVAGEQPGLHGCPHPSSPHSFPVQFGVQPLQPFASHPFGHEVTSSVYWQRFETLHVAGREYLRNDDPWQTAAGGFVHSPHDPPHPSSPQTLIPQEGWHTHLPALQSFPGRHVPQGFPQRSVPHSLPKQESVQLQVPSARHSNPFGHVPHVPPQESGPHVFPWHLRVQHAWVCGLHTWPVAAQVSGHCPPHPFPPEHFPSHFGVHPVQAPPEHPFGQEVTVSLYLQSPKLSHVPGSEYCRASDPTHSAGGGLSQVPHVVFPPHPSSQVPHFLFPRAVQDFGTQQAFWKQTVPGVHPQSEGQVVQPSPTPASQLPLPQPAMQYPWTHANPDRQEPQSAVPPHPSSQDPHCFWSARQSCGLQHAPSTHFEPPAHLQSAGQVAQFSPLSASQTPFMQNGSQNPSWQVAPGPQFPQPATPPHPSSQDPQSLPSCVHVLGTQHPPA